MGTLFIVATPIGNLKDITLRAIETLKSVDFVACEDTRVTGRLLKYFEIQKPLISYFQHSKISKIEYIIEQLSAGKSMALVTDAGTPGISDPGQELIYRIRNYELGIKNVIARNEITKQSIGGKDCRASQQVEMARNDNSIKIIPIPGPSALMAAASVSGMIEKEFYFAGFLPKKKGRETQFKKLISFNVPIIIYESAMRLEKTLEDLKRYFGEDTEVFIAREITKMFEEYWGGKVADVANDLRNHQLKGEIVVVAKKLS